MKNDIQLFWYSQLSHLTKHVSKDFSLWVFHCNIWVQMLVPVSMAWFAQHINHWFVWSIFNLIQVAISQTEYC